MVDLGTSSTVSMGWTDPKTGITFGYSKSTSKTGKYKQYWATHTYYVKYDLVDVNGRVYKKDLESTVTKSGWEYEEYI